MDDISRTFVAPAATLRDVLSVLDTGGAQIALVVQEQRLLGTITDGDIRRAILGGLDLSARADGVMNKQPRVVDQATSRAEALHLMERVQIRQLPVVDEAGRVVGLLLERDLHTPARPNIAFVLAGGRGTRLHPLTLEVPKPLVPVGGKPILSRIIERLSDQGIERFYLAVNHMADQIRDHFGDGSSLGVDIRYVQEEAPLGTAGALSLLPELPDEPMLVMNGDILTELDVGALLDFHRAEASIATMCVREFDMQVPYGVVERDGSRFSGVTEKPVHRFFVNAGIYCLSPQALSRVPSGQRIDMTTLFETLREAGLPAHVFPLTEYWVDIGQHADLERARRDAQNGDES